MITVNGVTIDAAAVAREMQHHPASSRDEAEASAARALVVHELLLQRAASLGIDGEDEDGRIATLLAAEVQMPEPTVEEIARYYRRNGLKFMTPALFEAAHIFFPARAGDEDARAQAKARAEAVLEQLLAERGLVAPADVELHRDTPEQRAARQHERDAFVRRVYGALNRL